MAAVAMARYFSDIRVRLALPLEDLGRRLGVDARVLAALEAGSVMSLPAPAETERIVRHYLGVLGLDPAPVLKVIAAAIAEIAPSRSQVAALPSALAPALPPTAGGGNENDAPYAGDGEAESTAGGLIARLLAMLPGAPRSRGVPLRGTLRTSAVIAVMVALAGGTVLAAQTAIHGMNRLPGPAASFVRSASDSMMMLFAPKRDGLRWIEVEDPRSRRGDKLQTARR